MRTEASPVRLAPRTVTFAGLRWDVKEGHSLGPGPNNFSNAKENVWVDEKGLLHLAITKRGQSWQCSEVVGPELGYGEYRWVISGNLRELDPKVVLGLFVYRGRDRTRDTAQLPEAWVGGCLARTTGGRDRRTEPR